MVFKVNVRINGLILAFAQAGHWSVRGLGRGGTAASAKRFKLREAASTVN